MRSILTSIVLRRCNNVVRCPRNITGTHYYSTKPELTSVRYKMQRGPYNTISTTDIRFFDSLLGPNRLITDPDECESYNIDFPSTVRGKRARIFNIVMINISIKLFLKYFEKMEINLKYCIHLYTFCRIIM